MEAKQAATQQIGHYELRETLGFGALGTVYLAWDTKLNRNVALKVLTEGTGDNNLRQRFQLEAKTIAALKHPNIVGVLDYSDPDDTIQYIALERLEGASLFDLTQVHGPVSEQTALCIAKDVAAGLAYAHSQNVVHRDIKPDNVVLEVDRVVIIDFGAMRLTDTHVFIPQTDVDKEPVAVGTPGFMAPEQLTAAEVDARADIFAFGALLYHACTSRLPYSPPDEADATAIYKEAKRNRYRDPRDYQPLLTPGFCDLLADCLSPSASDRPSSAAVVGERIDALLAAHGITDARAELKAYVDAPALNDAQDLRSVDALTRELKLALLRDLQCSIARQDEKQIRDATNRLRYVHHLFGTAEKYYLLDGREKPRLLRGRIMRRRLWFGMGFLSGAMVLAGLAMARPSWIGVCRGLVQRWLLGMQ